MTLLERFDFLLKKKNSVLCVGIDPALPRQRDRNVIPEKYVRIADENEARLRFCIDTIRQVKDNSIAIKPNQQYLIGFSKSQHQQLTEVARENDMLSILDYKLNDIGDTIESAIFHLIECGYDAITFNPLPGNLEKAIHLGHKLGEKIRGYELGLIVLTLMSNPEAVRYMKNARVDEKPMFLAIAEDVNRFSADGCVVGATGHVTEDDIRAIRESAGEDKIILIPGVGAQKGDPEKVIKEAGKYVLINVGRSIIYADSPRTRAKEYCRIFQEMQNNIKV